MRSQPPIMNFMQAKKFSALSAGPTSVIAVVTASIAFAIDGVEFAFAADQRIEQDGRPWQCPRAAPAASLAKRQALHSAA